MWYFYLMNALVCLYMARHDAKAANEDRPQDISHVINGAVHIGMSLLLWIAGGWLHGIAGLFESVIVFDTAMNLMRIPKRSPFYLPMTPKSLKDKIEKIVFFNSGLAAKIFYLAAFIVLICIA